MAKQHKILCQSNTLETELNFQLKLFQAGQQLKIEFNFLEELKQQYS